MILWKRTKNNEKKYILKKCRFLKIENYILHQFNLVLFFKYLIEFEIFFFLQLEKAINKTSDNRMAYMFVCLWVFHFIFTSFCIFKNQYVVRNHCINVFVPYFNHSIIFILLFSLLFRKNEVFLVRVLYTSANDKKYIKMLLVYIVKGS